MAGINFDTANTGYGGNYGGGYYDKGSNWTDLAALALVTGGFGFGGHGRHDYGYDRKDCCSPATCEQVNDCDRDVIKCSNDVDRDVLQSAFNVQRDVWTADRDVLLSGRDVKEEICHSSHRLEKDIWDTDKDVIMTGRDVKDDLCHISHRLEKNMWDVDKDILVGFKNADHKVDMLKCEMKEGFAEVKGLLKETALETQLREKDTENRYLARKLEESKDKILKEQIVKELLAAIGSPPVVAAN